MFCLDFQSRDALLPSVQTLRLMCEKGACFLLHHLLTSCTAIAPDDVRSYEEGALCTPVVYLLKVGGAHHSTV